MNPQFSQMGMMGAGRGMPMQMNPAFAMNPQMGGQMGSQQMTAQAMPQQNVGHPQIQKHIFTTLQNQGPFSGWQATVNIQERAAQVKLLVDSLRLVRPPVDLPRALEVALQFERKCFAQASDKEEYKRECQEKLGKIRDQRVQQINIQPMQGMQGMQGMQTPGQNFPVQMQQNMGNIQPQMQQNMGQSMGMPNMQQMHQRMPPQRTVNMQQQMMNVQPQMQQQQMPQSNQPKINELSVEDNKAINVRAAELAKHTPKDKMRTIVDQMNPQLRANLAARTVDPIIYYFRMLATKEFREKKAAENEAQMQNMSQLPDQQNLNATMNQQPPFMNDMGRFQGLQAEGLRSQETGEMVVPASNNTSAVPDHIRITQQMLANSQRMGQQPPNVNPGYLDQQRRLQQQQQQQNTKMQQAAQFQAQAQENARAQAQSQMQGQLQNNSQSNTPLSAINRPVNLSMQGVSPQPGSRPPSRTPMMNQQAQMGMNMQDAQNRERILARYPVHVQNILRQKPVQEWKATLEQLTNHSSMQRSNSQQPPLMQRQQSAQNQGFVSATAVGTPMQQSLSTGAMTGSNEMKQPGMPQNQGQINPEMLRQRQAAMQQQQQQHQLRMQAEQAKQGPQTQQGRPLNPQQMNLMDGQPVPPNVLGAVRQHAQLPQEIRTWLQLKQWVMNNPIQAIPMPRVMAYQAHHFAFMMKNKQQIQQQAQANLQQQHAMAQGQMPNLPGQGTFPNQPQFQIPTEQDIISIRAKNPKLQTMSDDQIRQAVMSRQRQAMQQQLQQAQQVGMQAQPMPPQQHQQQQPQSMPQQNQQPAPRLPPSQTPVRPPIQVNGQQSQDKGVKRPNEAVKTEPSQAAAMQPPGLRQLTREQFNALSPEAKRKYMKAHQFSRLIKIGKHVAGNAPKWQAVQLTNAARLKLVAKLTDNATKNMLSRFDSLLYAFWENRNDETEIRRLISNKLWMFAQYEAASIQNNNKTWVPVQNLSMTFEQADDILKDLAARFQQMANGLSKQQQPGQPVGPAQLTPENLSRLQEQENLKKSAKSGKDVPPAPTASQPPFQIGDRGHGAPKYGGAGIRQEDLKLDPKRRKKSHPAGQTPAQVPATPSAASPPTTKQTMPTPTFRCPLPDCERNKQPFTTQAELEQHTNAVHKIDTEPVTDPLAFLDASLREAFNLDENFKQIRKPASQSQAMEKTASKGSIANLKSESKPATPAAMTKTPSQPGRPPSNFNKDDMGLRAQADDWAHTNITLEELHSIFGDMDWEEAVPAAARELQDKFLRDFEASDEWQSMIRKPADTFTETTSDKSRSPTDPANKEPEAKKNDKDDLIVDLEVEGLDLTGLEELDNVSDTAPNGDVAMQDSDGSPFEVLDAPTLPPEQQFLLDHGIDSSRPESLTDGQKKLMAFITGPFPVRGHYVEEDSTWEEIDWAAEEQKDENNWFS